MSSPRVGVLAVQGAVEAHRDALERSGAVAALVRTASELDGLDGLVLPGGESTTMSMQIERNGLAAPLATAIEAGLPVFGTCAGLILLSREVRDGRDDQIAFGAIDVAVRRNGYGRQIASFEHELVVEGLDGLFEGVFIRAPRVVEVGPDVRVLAEFDGDAVLVCDGAAMGCVFHPELSGDDRLHDIFVDMCRSPEGATEAEIERARC